MTAPVLTPTRPSRASARAAAAATGATNVAVTPAAARLPLLQRPLASYHLLLGSAGALVTLGIVMVFSASSVDSYTQDGSSFAVVSKQIVFFVIGLPLAVVATRLPVRFYRAMAYPLLLVSVLGLLAVLVPGIGTTVSGARRWIDLGPFQLQPSEPAKLALALWGADLLARKQKLLGDWRHLVIPLLPVAAFLGLLIMLEPDMGTTGSLLLVVVGMLFVCGAPLRLFGSVLVAVGAAASLLAVTEPYRLARLVSFTDPCSVAHAQDKGYQACNGLTGLASGGWWGAGLGASRQKWISLPNAHTDYIFSIIGEELGLVGTLVVIALFGVLGYAGFRIASRTTDTFSRLAAAGTTTWLVGQAVINIGYVAGLLPVTGVPLPLISFGGTSLVLTMAAVGMLASFARQEPGAVAALAARRSRPAWTRWLHPAEGRAGTPRRTASRGATAVRAGSGRVASGSATAGRAPSRGTAVRRSPSRR